MLSFFRRKVRMALLIVLACAWLTAGCANLFPAEEEALAPPLIQPETVSYRTVTAARGDLISQIKLSGSFCAADEVALSFDQMGGRLMTFEVGVGDTVRAGDLIAELDSASLASSIEIQEIETEKASLTLAQLKGDGADSYSVRRAELDLQVQRIRLEDLRRQMTDTRIIAPSDGQVTYVIGTDVGELVSAHQTIVKIADVSRMNIRTTATEAAQLPLGAAVTVLFDDNELQGEVAANPSTLISDPVEQNRKSAVIRLIGELPETAALGRSVQIAYVLESREDVLVLPRSVINVMSGRYYVHVLEDGIRVEKDVEIGLLTATEAEIVSGIDEDDLIIAN